jgi:gliding motility-associated-like protein
MRYLTFCFLFLVLLGSPLRGQYITNGDMELGNGGMSEVPLGWNKVSGTPDHCQNITSSCPNCPYKIPSPSPQGGKWVRFFHGSGNNETFGQPLLKPLVKGNLYSLSFYVSYAKLNGSATNTKTSVLYGFSKGAPVKVGNFDSGRIFLNVPEKWVKVTFNFKASDNYDFISFGKYEQEHSNACFIDDVKLIGCNSDSINLGNDTTLCEGSELVLKVKSKSKNYHWQNNSTDSVFIVKSSGNYWVKVTSTCGDFSDSIDIKYTPLPKVALVSDTILCEGKTLNLDAYNPNCQYLWQDNSTLQNFLVTQKGKYWVKVTNTCGIHNDTILVDYLQPPQVYLGKDTTLCQGVPLTLSVLNPNYTYLWKDSTTKKFISITKSGNYWVQAKNQCGEAFDTLKVSFKDCDCHFHMSNAFSPNNDQLNEHFGPIVDCKFENYSFKIFNRWGELLFETTNPDIAWDGSYKEKQVPIGVYIFTAHFKYNNQIQTRQGSFTIIR